MTKEERELEQSSDDINLPSLQPTPSKNCETSLTDETVTELSSTTSITQQPTLNFSVGKSAFCLDAIVKNNQVQEARKRIKSEKAVGESMVSRL